jgi:hypothetical protein
MPWWDAPAWAGREMPSHRRQPVVACTSMGKSGDAVTPAAAGGVRQLDRELGLLHQAWVVGLLDCASRMLCGGDWARTFTNHATERLAQPSERSPFSQVELLSLAKCLWHCVQQVPSHVRNHFAKTRWIMDSYNRVRGARGSQPSEQDI